MTAPENGAVPAVANDEDEQTIELGGEIKAQGTVPVNTRQTCVMACSLPIGSCQFRCPLTMRGGVR